MKLHVKKGDTVMVIAGEGAEGLSRKESRHRGRS